MRKFFWSFLEIIEIFLIVFFSVFIIRHFLVQPFLVSGSSMEPNFKDGDYLLIDEFTYRFREPKREDVVVFRAPMAGRFFIKRIIGLPNEKIEIKQGKITITTFDNQEIVLKEDYLFDETTTSGDLKVFLNSNQYFVLGDNREAGRSFDSRAWGPLEKEDIIGLVRLRIWPLQEVAAFR